MKPTRRSVLRGIAATVAAALAPASTRLLAPEGWTLVRIVEPRERYEIKVKHYARQIVTGRMASKPDYQPWGAGRRTAQEIGTALHDRLSLDYAAVQRRVAAIGSALRKLAEAGALAPPHNVSSHVTSLRDGVTVKEADLIAVVKRHGWKLEAVPGEVGGPGPVWRWRLTPLPKGTRSIVHGPSRIPHPEEVG